MKSLYLFAAVSLAVAFDAAASNLATFTNSATWTCPTNVTAVRVECWGAGGAGGSASRNPGSGSAMYSGGGAGGAYAKYTSYAVTPGQTYFVNVGVGGFNDSTTNGTTAAGGDSWFNSVNEPSTIILAKGGAGGASAIGNTIEVRYGAGGIGTTVGSAGDIVFAGGSGATGASSSAGGGGSSAGTNMIGTSTTSNLGGVAPAAGGNGGTGPTSSSRDGSDGFAPGGGGSGARDTSTTPINLRKGGRGASGKVILTDVTGAPYVYAVGSMPTGSGTGTNGLTIYKGEKITLTEIPSAGYAPFTYAWKKVGSGTVLSTSNTLVVSFPVNGDQYTCDVASIQDGVVSTSPPATITVRTIYNPAKVVIIKADDYWGNSQPWSDFIQASRNLGIKVSAGVVPVHIVGDTASALWMQQQQAMGDVEFWNHGWDHLRWNDTNGHEISEFDGSGLTHMREHMALAQAGIKEATGRDPVAFGTPYNGFDNDTATVMNETPVLKLLFSHTVSDGDARLNPGTRVVDIISEMDGTGNPNAAEFIAAFPPGRPGPVSLQFHPDQFDAADMAEYIKIVQYLLTNDYSIILPAEFVGAASLAANFTASPANGSAPLTVTFTDISTTGSTITNRFWDFGDGTTTNTTAISLAHIYQVPGTNNVTLIVSDATGSSTNTKNNLIVATYEPPQVVINFTSSSTWVCPPNVTSVKVQCWGGGGGGGSASRTPGSNSTQYGGGGAGGAYARHNSYPVIPGNTYYINVGEGGFNNSPTNATTVPGGDSWFNSINAPSTVILAKGGAGGESAVGNTTTTRYGSGGIGTTNGSAGEIVHAGGSGATGAASAAGGGGSSAGTNVKGNNAVNHVGATAPTGGGNGGTGPTTSSGIGGDGFVPGGGGSGARDASLLGAEQLRNGGRGASGQVTLSYANNTVVDSIGDGIPDWWRAQYFGGDGTTTNADSCVGVDFDHDGRSNGDEYFADTNPTNAASRLAVISLMLEANDIHLTWIGGSNAWQSIENCNGLTDTNGWSALFTNAPPTTITNTVIETGAGEAAKRFYRIRAWR